MLHVKNATGEKLASSFAVADTQAVRKFCEFVDVLPGFCGHAELAIAEAGFDVFGSVSRQRDFEIVDEGGAVHRYARNESAFHQVDQDRTETNLDNVAADAPENGTALFARAVNGGE